MFIKSLIVMVHLMYFCTIMTRGGYRFLLSGNGKILSKGYCFKEVKGGDVIKCMELCLRYSICKSINYDIQTSICSLNVKSTWSYTNILRYPDNIAMDRGDFPNMPFPCAMHSCNATSICINDGVCVPVFEGKFCQSPRIFPNSSIVDTERYPVGFLLKYECDTNYTMHGVQQATCRDEEFWSFDVNEFECLELCSTFIPCTYDNCSDGRIENVAVNKAGNLSSSCDVCLNHSNVRYAFDGITNTSLCTHTDQEPTPWLMVDLGCVFDVLSVNIFLRQDCCGGVFKNVYVLLGSNSKMIRRVCGFFAGPAETGQNVTIHCLLNTRGQFVKVQSNNNDTLTVCELQVFAIV